MKWGREKRKGSGEIGRSGDSSVAQELCRRSCHCLCKSFLSFLGGSLSTSAPGLVGFMLLL